MSTDYKELLKSYKGKKVLVTGNTGFKGSWLTYILLSAGADVCGYSLKPSTDPNLFEIAGLDKNSGLKQVYADVRDLETLKKTFEDFKPEFVLHLAAQPIVRDSYKDPVYTYSTNVMGTVNICECVRLSATEKSAGGFKEAGYDGVKSFLNVTTDKVYKNNEIDYGYKEEDPLDGYDPYSNSKSCSELVTHSYNSSFLKDLSISVSTARAGNVIGGGDFSNDRIIPDCVRALMTGTKENKPAVIGVRNPYSTRPYQHVLEPLFAYLMIAMKQYEDTSFAGYYNVGPDDCDCVNTGDLVTLFTDSWNKVKSDKLPVISWENRSEANAPHEANFLKLDCAKLKKVFDWTPGWHIGEAVMETVNWTNARLEGKDILKEMDNEIARYVDHTIA